MNRFKGIALLCGVGFYIWVMSIAQAHAVAPTLPEVTADSEQSVFSAADKPIGILLVSSGCATCGEVEATISGAASKHPNMTFVKADAALFNQPAVTEPAFGVFVPSLGVVYRKLAFHPTAGDVDAFLVEREVKATAELALVNQVSAASAKMEAADASYIAQLKGLEVEGAIKLKPLNEQMKGLREQKATASKPYDEKIEQLNQKLAEATKPYSEALEPLQVQLKAAGAPFKRQAEEVVAEARKVTGDLVAQQKAAVKAQDKARFDAVKAQLDPLAKPFDDQLAALKEKYEAATKSILAQMEPIQHKGDELAAPILIEINTAKLLEEEETKELDEQIGDLKAQAGDLTAPLDAQAAAIDKARDEALKPFADEIAKGKGELESLVKADNS
jgi:hypothetical protein